MDCSLPGSSTHGISQGRRLERVAIPFSRESSQPRDWTHFSCIGRWILYHWVTWEAHLLERGRLFYICKTTQEIASKTYLGTSERSYKMIQFSSVQPLSCVLLFATAWIAARQASLSITNSWSLSKLMSIESVMPSSHLILCHPLPLLPPILPSIRVFSNESTLPMRWPKYWSFSFSISPSNEHPGLISSQMISVAVLGNFLL